MWKYLLYPFLKIWNPRNIRDSKGRIIDDWKRRKNSKETKRKIESGAITLPQKQYGKPGRYIRLGARGSVSLIKQKAKEKKKEDNV